MKRAQPFDRARGGLRDWELTVSRKTSAPPAPQNICKAHASFFSPVFRKFVKNSPAGLVLLDVMMGPSVGASAVSTHQRAVSL